MPNHITNEIKVLGGTNKERFAFIRAITNKRGLIDFNNITAMPKSMDIEEGTYVEMMASAIAGEPMGNPYFCEVKPVKDVVKMLRDKGVKPWYIKKLKQQAKIRIDNKRRYGFYSWLDWSREKRGTKWNAYSVEMPVEMPKQRMKYGYKHQKTHVRAYAKRLFKKRLSRYAASGAELVIRFDTAWCCPEPIFIEMARRFPHLEFHIRYADEDMGSNCGSIFMTNGENASSDIDPRRSEQSEEERHKWRKFAFEVRYPGKTPQQHGMNDKYEYVDSDE
ncbi:hypothetical protein [Dickeya lacustris]|uniref:YubB ferredoxin-like domain-containing protein n=1 Tax=Dickeya lacustris TaxID=2259638 RepID=A0ABY8G7N2_9GAMM|nr:hypothetical protein [Dickeya lacustris]WFN55962.1 hypothetical protein O1Q98_01115 [Dickeya lacustris]